MPHTRDPREFIERREGYARITQEEIQKINEHIAEEKGLFRTIKFVTTILSVTIGVVMWVFLEKNNDIKAMQAVLNTHSVQISETLAILKSSMDTNRREADRIERLVDGLKK